jgi:hypothetical protein
MHPDVPLRSKHGEEIPISLDVVTAFRSWSAERGHALEVQTATPSRYAATLTSREGLQWLVFASGSPSILLARMFSIGARLGRVGVAARTRFMQIANEAHQKYPIIRVYEDTGVGLLESEPIVEDAGFWHRYGDELLSDLVSVRARLEEFTTPRC